MNTLNTPENTTSTNTVAKSSSGGINVIGSDVGTRIVSQVQTLAMAAVLLTMTLGLWWWAETDHGP